jgi:hypothetical protein
VHHLCSNFVRAQQHLGYLHSIDETATQHCRDIYASVLRNCAAGSVQQFCSGRATVHQRMALTLIRTLASTHSCIPTHSLTLASFQTLKVLRPMKSPMLEYKQTCTHSDTHDNVYTSSPQARFHVHWRARTQASTSALVLERMRTFS